MQRGERGRAGGATEALPGQRHSLGREEVTGRHEDAVDAVEEIRERKVGAKESRTAKPRREKGGLTLNAPPGR